MPSTIEPVVIPNADTASRAYGTPAALTDAPAHVHEPSPDDSATLSNIWHLLALARDYRRPMIPRWRNDYRMLFNRFWQPSRYSWLPSPQVPEIFPILRALAGFMVDRRITNTVAPYSLPMNPWNDFLSGLADDLEVVLDSSFQANCEEREWIIAIIDAYLYGTGITKTCWETQLAGGMGDAMTRRVHPFAFYPDPRATTEHDGDFYIELKKMTLQELDRRFPGAYERVKDSTGIFTDTEPPPNLFDFGNGGPRTPFVNPGAISPNTQPANWYRSGSSRMSINDVAEVTVIEAWVREHEFVEVVDDKTGAKAQFPVESWRVVVIAGNQVLLNVPAKELWDHGGHPYSRFTPFDMGEFWGPSLVELLTSSQHAINRILAAMQQNVELTGNPVWKDTSQNNRTPITNKPGSRMTVGKDGLAGWENPPSLNPASPQLLQYHLARMEAISGVTAINKGGMPGGRNAQGTIEAVQESAFVVIRLAQKFLEYAMRNAGELRASLIVENYTTPRLIAIAGRDAEKSFRVLKARHFTIPTSNGAIPMKFQLNIDAGSRQNTARQLVEDRALQAFTVGLIDGLAALQAMDWPDAVEVDKRNQEKQMAMAQAQQSMKNQTRALSAA